MCSTRRLLLAGLFIPTCALVAWQSGLAALGWTEADLPNLARYYFESSSGLPGASYLKQTYKLQWKQKGAAERTQLIQQLGAAARRYVASPGFEAQYNQWIRQRYNAVNHGIKADAAAAAFTPTTEAGANNMMAQAAAQVAQQFTQMPIQTLQMLFQNDLDSWKSASDAKEKKLYARAKQIEPLMKTNEAEFKKQYGLLKSMSMGGPDTLAGVESASAGAARTQAEMKKIQEQRAFDEHTLKVELKRRLTDFVKLAQSVDFNAQLKAVGNHQVFVNPAYQSKSSEWKQLYRLGKEPTLAAVTLAQQWLKEL